MHGLDLLQSDFECETRKAAGSLCAPLPEKELVMGVDVTFGCKITDRDYLAAFAPKQPEEIKVGQNWMRVEDGQTLPVWRVRHDSPLKSGGPRIDLGHDRLVVGMGEEQLRREWVCTDPPENVTELRPSPQRIPYDQPQTWYFTFGSSHRHANRYVVVREATSDEAREQMFDVFGREWGFQYDDVDWHKDGVSQAEQYGLTELT